LRIVVYVFTNLIFASLRNPDGEPEISGDGEGKKTVDPSLACPSAIGRVRHRAFVIVNAWRSDSKRSRSVLRPGLKNR
jgi:hypothetical protein